MKVAVLLLIGLAAATAVPQQKRGFDLLGALGKVTDGTKMGTAIKVMNAFSKVHSLLDDIKNLAPELHKALNSSITDIEHAFGSIIDDIGSAIDPVHKSKRDVDAILGGLGINVFGAFSKVAELIADVEVLAPHVFDMIGSAVADVEQAFEDILGDIEHAFGNMIDEIIAPSHESMPPTGKPSTPQLIQDPKCQDIDPNCIPQLQTHYCTEKKLVQKMCQRTCNMCPLVPASTSIGHQKRGFDLLGALGKVTDGTKMGTALKVINAFSKVHSLLDDIKNLAPELHKALNSSITDIEHAFGSIIDDIGSAIDPKH